MSRIAYVFTSHRDAVIARALRGEDADTSLHGLNHIAAAEYFTVWRPLQALWYLPRLLRYDAVISQDNLLLGYLVSMCARLLHTRARWFYLAMNSSTLIRRHGHHPLRLFLLKRFWSSYARIICIAKEQIEDFVRLGIPRERLVFIPFGVDTTFFHPTDTSLEEELVVSGGRDSGRDYDTLFKAAERLRHPFEIFAGERALPRDTALPSNVSAAYNISLQEVRALYERARTVVVVSKSDAVPDGSDCSGQTVILDALAAGKAVIATDRLWIKDYFVSGKDLLVVPPNDPVALARTIDTLMSDGAMRTRLAAAGRSAVERYTTKAFAEALRTLMSSVI